MQEEIEHKTVNLAISTTKLSARTLLRGMQFLLRQYDKHASQGKQSMKRLVRQNRGVTNVEIQKTGIKDFDRYAKRYHIDYSIQKDLLFSLESLANLARNGRVKPAVAAVARMLGIRVIGQASEAGELDVLCKTRGEHGALERIVLELKEHGYTNGRLHISHCGNPAAAERLKHMVKAVFDGAKVDISECGGLCSYYAELGGLLVGYEDAEA